MSDSVGRINIPDNKSFYMVLTTTTLNILTSRRNQITKTIDVIDIRGLNKISQTITKEGDLNYKGGMEILGTFDEGTCFRIVSRTGFSYIICSIFEDKVNDLVR